MEFIEKRLFAGYNSTETSAYGYENEMFIHANHFKQTCSIFRK